MARTKGRTVSPAKAGGQLGIGDSVIVKADVRDPDLGIDIGGWQGTIIDVSEAEGTVGIAWDSATLEAMPPAIIDHCEREGLAWDEMYLSRSEVEAAPQRDTPAQRAKVLARLQSQHRWSHLGDEGAQIQAVIGAVDDDDEWAVLEAWEAHLRQVLRFPFEAVIVESQDYGSLRMGDRLKVQAITDNDDLHGLIVRATHQGDRVALPLCDLKVADPRSPNHDPVQAYAAWFANR
jgi:hypothetical protein